MAEWVPGTTSPETDAILSAKLAGNKAVLKYIKEVAGEDGLQRVLQALSEKDRSVYSSTILAAERVSETTNMALLFAVDKVLFKGDTGKAVELGKYVLEDGLNFLYRMFFKAGNPLFIIKRSPLLWQQYHKLGTFEVYDTQPKSCRAKLVFPYLTVIFCRVTEGFIISGLELSGGRDVQVRHETCAATDDHCTYHITWS